jgi:N4-gp56 family major capsid protein
MATTSYATGNALAVKLFAKKLFQEALKQTYFSRFMGSGTSNIVQLKNETSKGPGDQITYGLRMQLSGAGIQGDGQLEGNEEGLITYSDALLINQLRHAVRSAGKMSEQRVTFDVRDECRVGLQDWWADRLDQSWINQIAGNTVQTDTRYTGNNATVAPDTAHKVFVNANELTDASISTTSIFSFAVIDKAVEKAKTASPLIRPVNVDGTMMFVCLLHPVQVTDLRITTTTGGWLDIQKAAMTGGRVSDNPIFTGALGVYNNTVLHEAVRLPAATTAVSTTAQANTRRAVFCGAQSAVLAYGQNNSDQEMTWVEELFDYGNQLGVSAGLIFGVKKTVFNSADFGTITIPTYAATH